MSGPDKPRRGRRILGPEERALWNRVAATAAPIRRDAPPGSAEPPNMPELPDLDDLARGPQLPSPKSKAGPKATRSVRPDPARRGPLTSVTHLPPEASPVGRPQAGLDRRTAERLRKGAREPDARIDLHGMTAERAHGALLTFLGGALGRGHRVVLVITGKGRPRGDDIMSRGRGVLRDSLPGWLRASPIGHSIVGIYQAHQKHGGSGAFYVYLKRRR